MSVGHTRKPLNASRARARKRALAARDGAWCVYCGLLFADLRKATIDHVVPISLFRTWRAEHTVLACLSCNNAKGDRLPLLLSVLLAPGPCAVNWLLLARLAAANESAGRQTESADSAPDQPAVQSMPDLAGRRAVRTARTGAVRPGGRTRPHPADGAFTCVTPLVTPASHPRLEAA